MKKLKRYLSLLLSCTMAFSNSVFSCAETVSNTEYVHSDDIDYDNRYLQKDSLPLNEKMREKATKEMINYFDTQFHDCEE